MSLTTIDAYNRLFMGVDAEVFVVDNNDKVVPAKQIGLPLYTESPLRVRSNSDSDEDKVTVHADGIVAEFTAAHGLCRAYLLDRLFYGLRGLNELAKKKGYKIKVSSSEPVDEATLNSCSKTEIEFGCAPETIAWLDKNFMSNPDRLHQRRYAGAHIHFGYIEDLDELNHLNGDYYTPTNRKQIQSLEECLIKNRTNVVKALDICVGVPMLLIDRAESSTLRRQYYGKPGAYRKKDYGLEYRVLSNESFLGAPWLASTCLVLSRAVVTMFLSGYGDKFLDNFSKYNIPKIFFENDLEEATRISARAFSYLGAFDSSNQLNFDGYVCLINLLTTISNNGGIRNAININRTFNYKEDITSRWSLSSEKCKHGRLFRGGIDTASDLRYENFEIPQTRDFKKEMLVWYNEFTN